VIGSVRTGSPPVESPSYRTGAQSVRTAGDQEGAGAAPPLTPVFPLWAWFRADAGVTEVENIVTAWADQSGNNRNTTAVGTVDYVPGGINGLPAIGFGNFQVRCENASDNIPHGARTIMTVAQPYDLIGGTLLSFRRSTRDWAAYLFNLSGTLYVWSDGLIALAKTPPAIDYSGAARLIEHVQDGVNGLVVRVDGTTIVNALAGSTSNEDGLAGFVIGNREPGSYFQHWFGAVGETLWYDYALTPEQRAQNVAYLSAKWGVSG